MVSLASGVAIPRTRALDRRAFRFNKGYLLVLPAVIYVLALIGFPLGMGIWYSLITRTVAMTALASGSRTSWMPPGRD